MKKYSLYLLLVFLFLGGCAQLPTEYPKFPTTAFSKYQKTKLGKLFLNAEKKHPNKSGFKLIPYGQDAFTARIAMARMAEKSLDLQYYVWHSDKVGTILAYEILKAADRGVKVRILLDDIEQEGRDNIVAAMDAHPNIQIRLYNPFANRDKHLFDFIHDFKRVNHRMHNKTFITDNALIIVGGRNIGDRYFAVGEKTNFRDLDIATAGPVVRDISKVYDYFWNGTWSVPISALTKRSYTQEDLYKIQSLIKQKVKNTTFPYALNQNIHILKKELIQIRNSFTWAKGIYVWDDPGQMMIHPDKQRNTMIKKLENRVKTIKKCLCMESAYFVPRPSGMQALKELQKRGVKVRILTNSLASNDVVPAHAGYAGYRKQLIRAGVALYELRGDAGANKIINKKHIVNTINSGLHTKALVFDYEAVFVGSFNLDPRSAAINTEGGLYIESKKIAKEVLLYMQEGIKPQNSYKVKLDSKGHLIWTTLVNGKQEVYHHEPEAEILKRIESEFIELLPVELQL
jgi:putative cardiolipin synthase